MNKPHVIIGRAEKVQFPELGLAAVPARIDTGAQTSSIWASDITQRGDEVQFVLFDTQSEFYTGEVIVGREYRERIVVSSNGTREQRYYVRLLMELGGRKVRGYFSLANRSQQVYPVLVGRNVLAGKFLVDVKLGTPLNEKEIRAELRRKFLEENL